MRMSLMAIVLYTMTCTLSMGQIEKPCSAPEASQFDFWIGEWDLTWTDKDGAEQRGANVITREFGGCVIRENFNAPAMKFRGMSVSVFDARQGKWKQTWVDDAGGYLDFTGEFRDRKMILRRVADAGGKLFVQRMIWYNISTDSLDWNWERSDDNGATWNILWKIRYTRKQK